MSGHSGIGSLSPHTNTSAQATTEGDREDDRRLPSNPLGIAQARDHDEHDAREEHADRLHHEAEDHDGAQHVDDRPPVELGKRRLGSAIGPHADDRDDHAEHEEDEPEPEGEERGPHARGRSHRVAREQHVVAELHAERDDGEECADRGEDDAGPEVPGMSYFHLGSLLCRRAIMSAFSAPSHVAPQHGT